jgi:hypothetical protein
VNYFHTVQLPDEVTSYKYVRLDGKNVRLRHLSPRWQLKTQCIIYEHFHPFSFLFFILPFLSFLSLLLILKTQYIIYKHFHSFFFFFILLFLSFSPFVSFSLYPVFFLSLFGLLQLKVYVGFRHWALTSPYPRCRNKQRHPCLLHYITTYNNRLVNL